MANKCGLCGSKKYKEHVGCRSCSECECGSPKEEGKYACKRCDFLDGFTGGSRIVEAMRQLPGPASTTDITNYFEGEVNRKAVHRAVRRLALQNRITEAYQEYCFLGSKEGNDSGTIYWQLTEEGLDDMSSV